jgi:probable rRNA maturation factor
LPSEVIYIRAPKREGRAVAWLRRDVRGFLAALGIEGPVELSLTLTDDRHIAALNRQHRSIDRPTDVLSFPQPRPPGQRRVLGDLVISVQMARREAAAQRVPLRQELGRYAAHGLLHLLGHDHETEPSRKRMARLERKILGGEGLITETSRRGI